MTDDRWQMTEFRVQRFSVWGAAFRAWGFASGYDPTSRPHKQGYGFRGSLRACRSQFIAHSRMWSAQGPTLSGEKGVQGECMRSKLILFVLEFVLMFVNQNFIADERRWTSTTTRTRTKAGHPTSVLCCLTLPKRYLYSASDRKYSNL